MEISWNTDYIDLQQLKNTSRGDWVKMKRYLVQFLELTPERMEILRCHLASQDRKKIRQIIHQMSPQLQFFGVPGIISPISRLGLEYNTMEWQELAGIADLVIDRLEAACLEIQRVIETYFEEY